MVHPTRLPPHITRPPRSTTAKEANSAASPTSADWTPPLPPTTNPFSPPSRDIQAPRTPPITPSSPARGINGYQGTLEPLITWQKEGGPAGRRETWWPMLSWGTPTLGNQTQNHWAVGGCLEKFDRFQGGIAQHTQYANRSRTPEDVIKTVFGIDNQYDAFNAGHCNQEAMRSAFFADPAKSVTRDIRGKPGDLTRSAAYKLRTMPRLKFLATPVNAVTRPLNLFRKQNVTFDPSDIRGLMVLCMDNMVDQTKGNGGFEYVGYRYREPRTGDDLSQPWFDANEPYPHTVIEDVCKRWGKQQRRGIIIDCKPGQLLDNRLFDAGRLEQLEKPPRHFDPTQPPLGGEVKFYDITFIRRAEPDKNIHLQSWVHTADDGTIKSNWIRGNNAERIIDGLVGNEKQSSNPDFYWIAHVPDRIREGAPWIGFATATNPDVDMFEVWSLWQESIGKDWREVAKRYPDRVRTHVKILNKKATEGSVKHPRDLLRELDIPAVEVLQAPPVNES